MRARSLRVGCPVAAVVMVLPRHSPLVVGAYADAAKRRAQVGDLVYRAGGGIVTGSAISMRELRCASSGPVGARVSVSSLSLLGGVVTADRVTLKRGKSTSSTVTGLRVRGAEVELRARIPVPGVGYLTTGPKARVAVGGSVVGAAGLALHLTVSRAGLPAGTVITVASVGLPVARSVTPAVHKPGKKSPAAKGRPLTVTPPLALRHYDFPVAGPSDYIDTYGGLRTDVPGHWHHGDDIFAALGTPVVAVADGTINRVGWEKLGGWRLWVRDSAGDEFYYAHLSGYAPTDLHSNRVRAGQVIGFVGNTGDAFTTAPHLHFEIHPRQLLRLAYNGAVDPTSYLDKWKHLNHVVAPRPAHPPYPNAPQLRSEARYVFRQLLAARHLVRHGPAAKERPHVPIPAGANPIAPPQRQDHVAAPAQTRSTARGASSETAVIVGGVLLLLLGGSGFVLALRRRRAKPGDLEALS